MRASLKHFHTFAAPKGLYKGSTAQGVECGTRAERPRTLRRLRSVYEGGGAGGGSGGAADAGATTNGRASGEDADKPSAGTLSILSPFDEQEEWAKISEIMASFGTGLVRESVFVSDLEKEFQSRLGDTTSSSSGYLAASGSPGGVQTPVGEWLASLGLAGYEPMFLSSGYDDIDFINGVLEERDLKEMGVDSERERATILRAAQSLPCRLSAVAAAAATPPPGAAPGGPSGEVDAWLSSLRLDCYRDTFRRHLYCDMARVRRVWEVELSAVLDIGRVGHRRRMLASVGGARPPDLEGLSADLDQLKSNIQQLKDEIREKLPASAASASAPAPPCGTLGRPRKARPAPQPPSDLCIREPAQLLVGVPSALTTRWRHRPHALVSGAVTYVANYLGSTLVKELRGTESTKKSIQKLKKTPRESRTTPDIALCISYRGVKFLNTVTKELVCEHEIRNIHCACQDADDMTHFAYITKDHGSSSHFCHVFCVDTMDQATEVILTLGQAFEVAYQMALRDQLTPQHNHHHHPHHHHQWARRPTPPPPPLPPLARHLPPPRPWPRSCSPVCSVGAPSAGGGVDHSGRLPPAPPPPPLS
ncbi:ankyrin repeat and SAM domain-containing protein 1A-like [Schistocerca nitens]|uniref:ankyrin repeat and SAM domain-containing protein 1A-like n=1 Tax=Schistocerca nitens TaxID=7011 RepID=UPI002118F8B0|nr:ankyrin repeat and SAM domain-containing protein 1A-like [Schistocerca nitens]